jgi:hypothetical protein
MDHGGLSHLMYLGRRPESRAELEENYRFCHVCLQEGPLTREHVPPRKAFNSVDRLWDHLVMEGSTSRPRKARIRGGFVVKTLCKKCNQERCSQYAKAYVRFVHELVSAPQLFGPSGAARLIRVRQDTLLLAKEIATMILAVEPIHFARHNHQLRQFVLDEKCVMHPGFQILAFLVPDHETAGTITRFHARVDTFAPGLAFAGGEISWYPFGFVYTSQIGKGYDVDRFTDITNWFTTSDPTARISSWLPLHLRLTGVESIQVGVGDRRVRPHIDYLPSTSLITP